MARRVYIYCKDCTAVVERGACEHQYSSTVGRSAAPLTVYFEGPNGEVQFPGRATDRLPKRLQKLGYEIKTIQDSHQYGSLMKRMDKEARKKYEAYQEALHERFEAKQRAEREYIRAHLKTQFGRDFYEEAVRASERGTYSRGYSPGSHLEGFEYDTPHGRD